MRFIFVSKNTTKTMLVSLFHSISNLMCSISSKINLIFFENLSLDDVDYHVWYNNRCHRVNWHVYFFILNNKLIFVGPRSTCLISHSYYHFEFLIIIRVIQPIRSKIDIEIGSNDIIYQSKWGYALETFLTFYLSLHYGVHPGRTCTKRYGKFNPTFEPKVNLTTMDRKF